MNNRTDNQTGNNNFTGIEGITVFLAVYHCHEDRRDLGRLQNAIVSFLISFLIFFWYLSSPTLISSPT